VQRQLKLVPEAQQASVLDARHTPEAKRTEAQKAILREFPTFQDSIILGEIDPEGAKRVEAVRKKATDLRATKPTDPRVHALVESAGTAPETFLFHRGDYQQPKERILPGGLTVLESVLPQGVGLTNDVLRTTGRRLEFARQLTDGRHPLVTRVLVNRFWHHLFGAGLVPTLADFGALGERPSHPELLDWLATEFQRNEWRLKPFLRTLVTSEAYRQSSDNPKSREMDPDNRLLARQSLRRLDAESLRDAMLAITGRAEGAMYGQPVPVAFSPQHQVVVGAQLKDGNGDPTSSASVGAAEYRRSIYVTVKRTAPVGVLETFDAPLANPNCEVRAVSTVPLQSLALMNDPFILARSKELAERVRRVEPESMEGQATLAWRILFGTEPTPEDQVRSVEYLRAQAATIATVTDESKRMQASGKSGKNAGGAAPQSPPEELALASYCQALLSGNRFLYLE
jgi:hypothetical protein